MMLPILGLWPNGPSEPVRVQWADGTPCGGILGSDIEQALERRRIDEAEEAHKQELRDRNVVLLDDYRHGRDSGSNH
jgi:hypothetical protein